MKTLRVVGGPSRELAADPGREAGKRDDQIPNVGRSSWGDSDESATTNKDLRKVTMTISRRAMTGD